MNKQEYMDKLNAALNDFDDEVKKEIVDDYEEHFEMGLANGKTEEQIVEELGSIEDLVNELKELKSEKKSEKTNTGSFTDYFNFNSEDVANAFNDVAKGFAGFLGSMAATLTKGAEKMTNSMSDGAESFADTFVNGFETVSDKVVNKTTAFAKEVAESYKNTRGEGDDSEPKETVSTENDCAEPTKDVDSIVVDTDCGDINVHASECGLKVTYENHGTANQKLAYRFDSYQKGSTFYVIVKKQPGTTSFFKSLTCPDIDIDVALPANMKLVEIKTASGDICCNGISAKECNIYDISGDLEISNSGFETLGCKEVSGDITVVGVNVKDINAKSVSGDVHVEVNGEEVKLSSTSGDISAVGKGFEKVRASSVSGDIELRLFEAEGFAADVASTSGDIKLRFGESVIKGSKSGKYVLGNGAVSIKANSISGSVDVEA